MKARSKFSLSLFLLSLLPAAVSALPFNVGERLEFTLSWAGIPAGETVMEIREIADIGGRDALHMVTRSRSGKIVSAFYYVNNRVDSYVDAETLAPLKYEVTQQKKGRRRFKSAIFDPLKNEVEFTRDGKKEVINVPPDVFDSFSIIYYLRTLKLDPGMEIELNTFSNGKLYITVVRVAGRERVEVEAGSFDTVKVHTRSRYRDSKEFREKGGTYTWLTDDRYKIPVKIKTKISVGHITAELKEIARREDDTE